MSRLKEAIKRGSPDSAIDYLALHDFISVMKEKLSQKRKEGRGGWYNDDECDVLELYNLLSEHFHKLAPEDDFIEAMDPHQLVDIANLAMFLYHRIITLKGCSHDTE